MDKVEPTTLLPSKWEKLISKPVYFNEDVEIFRKEIASAQDFQDLTMHRIDPQAYRLPLETALYLYRDSPVHSRELVLNGIAWGTGDSHFGSLAAAAREAFDQKDYELLGMLAYRFEQSLVELNGLRQSRWSSVLMNAEILAVESLNSGAMGFFERVTQASKEKLISRLEAAFHYALVRSNQFITQQQASQAASGYFHSVPTYMILPEGVANSDSEQFQPWTILTTFLKEPIAVLRSCPVLTKDWSELKHPRLQELMLNSIESSRLDEDQKNSTRRKIRNPFSKAAGRYGLLPTKARPEFSGKMHQSDQAAADQQQTSRSHLRNHSQNDHLVSDSNAAFEVEIQHSDQSPENLPRRFFWKRKSRN